MIQKIRGFLLQREAFKQVIYMYQDYKHPSYHLLLGKKKNNNLRFDIRNSSVWT